MTESRLRCFAAVEVASPQVRRALELAQLGLRRTLGARDPVKWVPSHQFHFTLKFFGEIDPEAVATAARVLDDVAAEWAPFRLEAAGLGAFPDVSRPQVIWCGVGRGREELVQLAGRVEEAMVAAGFPPERRAFRPHLTLGRVRAGEPVPPALVAALRETRSYGAWQVERLVLMRSELLPGGPRYTPLHEAALRQK